MPLNAQNTAPEMGDLQSRMNIKHDLVLPGLPKESPQVLYQRPVLPQVYNAAEGHFQFHYTNTGTDAVAQVYTNPDGVPDFIYEAGRCAERVYRLLIDTLGFQPPPSDGIDGDATDFTSKTGAAVLMPILIRRMRSLLPHVFTTTLPTLSLITITVNISPRD